jgi:crotonobetainyl-CoA:carnitine CoA-transferase CaiB-like acyl-CoA transferase
VFDCADGWIIIATGNDAQYQRLCALLGLEDMATAPEYLTNADRIANRDEMTRLLTEATLQRSKAELLAACEAPRRSGRSDQRPGRGFRRSAGHRAGDAERGRRRAGRAPALPVFPAEVAPHRPAPKLGEDDDLTGWSDA